MKSRHKLEIDTYGDKNYSKNNKAHREDGPAHVFPSIMYYKTVYLHYYIEGCCISNDIIRNDKIIKTCQTDID